MAKGSVPKMANKPVAPKRKGAPKGNRFWELRSKHGRDTLFNSPELMWEAASEYFTWCEANPLIEIDFVGKDAKRVRKPKMRPYTWQGLCMYLDCWVGYFWEFEKSLEGKTDAISKDFSKVATRIRETIYLQKFTGAASGFLNPLIISRDLGLTDKKDITSAGEKLAPDFKNLSDKDLVALAKLQAKANAQ
jgi:hypothetical protein